MEAPPPPPPPPGTGPARLSDCIEELLRFTLSSGSPGLSGDYCSRLLQPDPDPNPNPNPNLSGGASCCGGVPQYPLYKHLARAIERCINSGGFARDASRVGVVPVDDDALRAKEDEWSKLVVDKGSELLNMLEGVEFELHVQEPYFTQLKDGIKTVEGRCAVGNYNHIAPGSVLLFNKCLLLHAQGAKRYSSFFEMLQVEALAKVLPGVRTIEEGVQIYRKFYAEEKEKLNGVLAISVSKLASQLYISLASLLSGLHYDGVGSLLGMLHTAGTVPDALPPPRSSLILSSMKLHRENVEGCFLTEAARALAKHINRSSEGWWGSLSGNDLDKNRLASEVINHIVNLCCLMNVHLIQPHGCVFEIRVREGYGARWSKDGSKFIGFLEPYTAEGYAKGWKH